MNDFTAPKIPYKKNNLSVSTQQAMQAAQLERDCAEIRAQAQTPKAFHYEELAACGIEPQGSIEQQAVDGATEILRGELDEQQQGNGLAKPETPWELVQKELKGREDNYIDDETVNGCAAALLDTDNVPAKDRDNFIADLQLSVLPEKYRRFFEVVSSMVGNLNIQSLIEQFGEKYVLSLCSATVDHDSYFKQFRDKKGWIIERRFVAGMLGRIPKDHRKFVADLNRGFEAARAPLLIDRTKKTAPKVEINFKRGVLLELQQYFYDCSIYPNWNLCGFCALITFCAITGNNYKTCTGLKNNLFGIVAYPTGFGKELMMALAKLGIDNAGLHRILVNFGLSPEAMTHELQNKEIGAVIRANNLKDNDEKTAVEQAIELMEDGQGVSTVTFAVKDEISSVLGTKDSAHKEGVLNLLLQIYSNDTTVPATKAMGNKYYDLTSPHFSFLGFLTPQGLASSLGSNSAASGFLGRPLVFVDCEPPKKDYSKLLPNSERPTTPESLVQSLKKVAHPDTGDDLSAYFADGAFDTFKQLDETVIEPMKVNDNETLAQIAGRLGEHTLKIAHLMAVSDNPDVSAVSSENIEDAWAMRLALYNGLIHLLDTEGGLDSSPHSKAVTKTLAAIERHCKKKGVNFIAEGQLSRKCAEFRKLKPRDREQVILSLEQEGQIRKQESRGGFSYHLL